MFFFKLQIGKIDKIGKNRKKLYICTYLLEKIIVIVIIIVSQINLLINTPTS